MSECLEYIFCCMFLRNNESGRTVHGQTAGNSRKKKLQKPKPKPSRIISKYKSQDIVRMTKQQKRSGKLVYTCPICTQLFNKILACNQCENNMCRDCVLSYEKKFQVSVHNMKCPFCNSETSNFIDYQQEAKSYFDTTGKNGFLDPVQRRKIDEQMKWNESKKLDNGQKGHQNRLSRIDEQQLNENALPTMNNIEQPPNESHSRNEDNDYDQNSLVHFRNSQSSRPTNYQNRQLHLTV